MPYSYHIGPMIKVLNKDFELLHTERANEIGLTPAQLFVLHYVSKHQENGVCHRDIEKQFELSHATVSGIISRLEAKGFINCFADSSDRRFKNIIVTDKAKRCDAEIKNHIDRYERQLVNGFSEEEKMLLVDFISRMIKNVEADKKNSLHEKKEDNQ